jgi:hypothetical protein
MPNPTQLRRPLLRGIPLKAAWPPRPGNVTVTMSRDQWDTMLAVAYDLGFILLELDDDERPVAAYCRQPLDRN